MLKSLASQKYILIGGVTPPAEAQARWAATVREDVVSPMRSLWPDMLAGKGGKVVPSVVVLQDVNPAFLGTGRKDMIESVIEKVNKGEISPLTPPLQ